MSDKNPSRTAQFRLSTPARLCAVAVSACFASLPALSNPVNPTVVNGMASFSQAGNVLTVTNSNGAIINWDKFSIKAGETTHFSQTSASSSVLNRVLSNDPSLIYGTLSSNGRVWLVNPAGIMVGAGGRVDVAGFVASTLNISNADFLVGRNLFVNDGTVQNVINQGEIKTPAGGSVYLIGSNVANEGIITTPKGETILAAGQTVSLIDSATPGVKVDIVGAAGNATNLGWITAEAGRIGIAGVIVRNSGALNASSVVSDGGRIFLKANGDTLVDGGKLAATSVGGKGGQVDVLGNRVAVMNDAEINVSGATGGGRIRIGGDYQGKNPDLQNANIAYFGKDAVLKADATEIGDGGTVIVWADDTTRAYGHIFARGGAGGGNGGFVETSGHRYLDFQGIVDTGAAMGVAGTLLLDPADIIIDNSTDNLAGGAFSGGWFSGATTNATLTWATINAQSGNLEIRTNSAGTGGNGDIIVNAGGSVTGPTTLTLLANRNINFGSGVVVSAGSANVNLIAGWNNTGWAVTPGTGLVNFGTNAALTTTTGDLYIYSGNGLMVQSGASLNVGGILDIGTLANPLYGNVLVNGSILSSGAAQNVYASGNVSVQATNTGSAGIAYSGPGTQTIQGSSVVLTGENASGGSSHGAQISTSNAASSQTVTATAGGINIVGGGYMGVGTNNSASISAAGSQTISAASALTLVGGDGADYNWAYLYSAGNQSITAASVALTGGISGNRAGTYIRGDGDQHLVTTAGGITLTAAATGTHFGGYATIVHGPASGNQLIEISGGGLTALGGGGTGLAYGADATPLVTGICAGEPACIANGVSANYAGINNRSGTTTLDMNGGAVSLQGGSGAVGTANQAYYTNGSTGAQTILDAGVITLAGGASGGNGYVTADGFHYLRNNATIFSPLGAQNITATSMTLSSTATAATGYAGAAVFGKGQTITMSGALTLDAGSTNADGGAVVIQSTAGQTINAGNVTLTAGGLGYDNTAAIKQTGGGAVGQTLNFTSLAISGGSGAGTGGDTGDCGVACAGHAASNHAGIYNAGTLGQSVNAGAGPITLTGGSGGNRNNAYIQNRSSGLQTVTAGSISLQGGDSGGENSFWSFGQANVWGGSWLANSASITSGWSGGVIGAQSITSAGAIMVKGNSGAGTGGMGSAGIASTGNQTVSGTSISLIGGAGSASYDSAARIVSLGTQSITANSLAVTAGTTGVGNRAGVVGSGQSIQIAGGLLTVTGGGTSATDFSNVAEILNKGGAGQSIVFSAAATMTVAGGAGSGVNPTGDSDCGAPCNGLSSWNVAQVRNESGAQTIDFQGGGSLTIAGGSNGNENYANVQNKTVGAQQILGNPAITISRGASGGVQVWAPSLVEHPGTKRWHELTNDAGIEADGAQTINAASITMNAAAGTAQGGVFIGGMTQNITVTGALSMTGGAAGDAVGAPIATAYGNATEFLFKAPAVIGNDSAGHSLMLNVGSLTLTGGGYGLYGGSPVLIGTYKHATNTTITSAGGIMLNAAPGAGSVQIGSFQGNGGSLTMIAGGAGMALDRAYVGTGTAGSVVLATSDGPWSQTAGGRIAANSVAIVTGSGDVTQPVGAVIDAFMLNAAGNNLSFLGDNLVTFVTLTSTGATGGIAYNTAADAHIISATADTGDVTLTTISLPPAFLGLGTITASAGNVTVTAEHAILDDNGAALNITGQNIGLTSNGGGAAGGLAISMDTQASGWIKGKVNGGVGGIAIRNSGNFGPAFNASNYFELDDSLAASGNRVGFHTSGNLDMGGASFKLLTNNAGDAAASAGGDLAYNGGVVFQTGTGAPYGRVVLQAGNDLTVTGVLGAVNGSINLSAGQQLAIHHAVTATDDILLFAPAIDVTHAVSASGSINVVGATVDISGIGSLSAATVDLAASDLTMVGPGAEIWASAGDVRGIFLGHVTLNDGAHIKAPVGDVKLAFLGADSTLYLNDGPGYAYPSYIMASPDTVSLAFTNRDSGGIVIDGSETAKTAAGGSGFYTGGPPGVGTPLVDGAGLEIAYPNPVGREILAVIANAIERATDAVDSGSSPTDGDGGSQLGEGQRGIQNLAEGGGEGSFGEAGDNKDDKKDDKDKKKSVEGKDEKKDEKPAQKKVAQCT
jgi:filamentous hemagglutinin family protein